MEIKIIREAISLGQVKPMAAANYGDMIKAVVDVGRKIMALGGELHADAEEVLLNDGSSPDNLWGINIYPDNPGDEMIVYSSLINISPKRGNRSIMIEIPEVKEKIREIVKNLIS